MRELSVAGQRYLAVLAVIGEGRSVTDVAAAVGVSRQSLHGWLARYEAGGLEGWPIGRTGRVAVRIRCPARLIDAASMRSTLIALIRPATQAGHRLLPWSVGWRPPRGDAAGSGADTVLRGYRFR